MCLEWALAKNCAPFFRFENFEEILYDENRQLDFGDRFRNNFSKNFRFSKNSALFFASAQYPEVLRRYYYQKYKTGSRG